MSVRIGVLPSLATMTAVSRKVSAEAEHDRYARAFVGELRNDFLSEAPAAARPE